MAREVGGSLRVNLGRKPEEPQIVDLMKLFNDNPNRIIAIAGTVGADGAPNTCPLTLIYARDDKTLMVGMLRGSATSANLRHNPRACLQIMGADDLVLGIIGTMRLIRDPLECSPAMAAWEFRVERVKQDSSPAQRVVQGPAAVYRSDKGEAFGAAAFAELQALAASGG